MKLVTLAIVVCCAAAAANANRAPQVRRISILELLESKPGLKEELAAKIKENKNSPAPPVTAQPTTPATTSAPRTTTTTAAPQANTPPDVPAEPTTPAGSRRRPNRRRNGNGRRRNPSVTEASERFADSGSNHRLRVVKEDSEAPQRRNGRQFPGAN